jgi:TfoX/Sxy family transcriptional regulator of competence genes
MERPTEDVLEFLMGRMEGVEAERRRMFGTMAWFRGGNMFIGAHGDRVFLRLSPHDLRDALEEVGVEEFTPRGRAMREYVALTKRVYSDSERFDVLFERSYRYASSLPGK